MLNRRYWRQWLRQYQPELRAAGWALSALVFCALLGGAVLALQRAQRDRPRASEPAGRPDLGAAPAGPGTLVERSAEALGGLDLWASTQSWRRSGRQTEGEDDFRFLTLQRRPNRFRTTLTRPEGRLRLGFDGQTAWMQLLPGSQTGPVQSLGESAESRWAALAQFEPPLIRAARHPDQVTPHAAEEIEGHRCYVLRWEAPGEGRWTFYLSAADFRPRRQVWQPTESDPHGELRFDLSDYREVEGLWLPHLEVTWLDGQRVSTVQTETIERNPGVTEDDLRPPANPEPMPEASP